MLGRDSTCSSSGARPDSYRQAGLAADSTLAPTLSANRRLALPLLLGAGLLVEAALPELGIESGTLHLALEPAQGAVETLVVLNDDFQAAAPSA